MPPITQSCVLILLSHGLHVPDPQLALLESFDSIHGLHSSQLFGKGFGDGVGPVGVGFIQDVSVAHRYPHKSPPHHSSYAFCVDKHPSPQSVYASCLQFGYPTSSTHTFPEQ